MEAVSNAPVLRHGALDRAHLTKHLLQLAKRVGVGQVTMRELAAEAGTAASSVYYHVRDKRELLDLLIESVLAQIEVPQEGDWETRLTALYMGAWQVLVDVPGHRCFAAGASAHDSGHRDGPRLTRHPAGIWIEWRAVRCGSRGVVHPLAGFRAA